MEFWKVIWHECAYICAARSDAEAIGAVVLFRQADRDWADTVFRAPTSVLLMGGEKSRVKLGRLLVDFSECTAHEPCVVAAQEGGSWRLL